MGDTQFINKSYFRNGGGFFLFFFFLIFSEVECYLTICLVLKQQDVAKPWQLSEKPGAQEVGCWLLNQ